MAEVLQRSMRLYIAPTTVTSATALATAYRVPFVSQDLNSQFDTVDRNVVLNSIVKEHSLVVREQVAGTYTKELYFSDTSLTTASAAVPDFWILKALGLNNTAANATPTGVTSAYTFTNTATPSTDWLNIYKIFDNATPSTGSGEVYQHTSARPTAMTWNFAVGSIVEPQITFAGLNTAVTSAFTIPSDTITTSTLDPAIPKSMSITIDGSGFNLTDLTLNLTGTTQNVESIATDGITNIINTGFAVTGSFNVLYNTADEFYKKFLNSTAVSAEVIIKDAPALAGNTGRSITFTIPNLKFSNVTPQVSNDFVSNAVEFTAANPTDQSSGAIEIKYQIVP